MILEIENLSVTVENKRVLSNLTLSIGKNEVHVVMGPNGAGKSTLAKTLVGYPSCTVEDGAVRMHGKDLLAQAPHERVGNGLFMSFQSPVALSGVNAKKFLFVTSNSVRTMRKQPVWSSDEFDAIVAEKMELVGVAKTFLERDVHAGFSGGEKKRFEMVQMALLQPTLAILDEVDSGLDVDAIKQVAHASRRIMKEGSLLIITHNPKLVDLFDPDYVHVLCEGKKVLSSDKSCVARIEADGYEFLRGGG